MRLRELFGAALFGLALLACKSSSRDVGGSASGNRDHHGPSDVAAYIVGMIAPACSIGEKRALPRFVPLKPAGPWTWA